MKENEFTYLLEVYKSALSYTDSFSDRMYARFNILLTLNVALAGLMGNNWLNSQSTAFRIHPSIPVIGLIISFFLYFQSAQDKYILNLNKKRVENIRKRIEKNLKVDGIWALFEPIDDTDKRAKNFIFENIASWRSNSFSLTRLPAIISILLIIFWTGILVLSVFL